MFDPRTSFGTRSAIGVSSSFGTGEDARALEEFSAQIWRDILRSVALGDQLAQALESLDEVQEECSSENWNGEGAKAVTPAVRARAERFLRSLPSSFPPPEVAADPDGEISFEWYKDARRLFSVSVGLGQKLNYAGIFGNNTVHGTAHFEDGVSREIIRQLQELLQP